MFKKVLIANRGEIALRVIWACKELGLKTVAVYSEADANSLHVRFADEAVCIGPPRNIESYLNIPAIISAAEITGADAIHPGYGFLSESGYLAEICEACNIKFIGPGPQAIRLMGDKSRAKKAMIKAGVPVVPGSQGVVEDEEKAVRVAREVGFPVILKASAGGGGRGMRVVREAKDVVSNFRAAQAEAQAAFGVPDVYIEKYVENPRHIEIQVMADSKGNVVHLGERECSVQRRHQKIIEEAPSTVVSEKLRRRMGRTAVEAAASVQYVSAGTVEFLLDKDGSFYFMEMNTRIQVEHGVTELVTGRDLVKEQIHVAAGEPLSFAQKDVAFQGHALECRINAEDPVTFMPVARHDPPLLPARRPGRPRRHVRARGLRDLAVLRQHDRQADDARTHARRVDRAHEALPRRDGRRGHPHQHHPAPADPRRPRLRRGPHRHRFHGALHAGPQEGGPHAVSDGAVLAPSAPEPAWTRWLPLLLLPISLLPDLAAALPLRSYFFRDFTVTFLPLRLFAARELREGRLAFWNPLLSEGSVQLPVLYPGDLLHVLWPGPTFVSWLLTLHLPLAALGGYWLLRELGSTRVAGFAAGVVLSLCGFTVSCLNLYVFLQALALAPFVAGLLRRAGSGGRRATAHASVLLALSLATLAVEFVAQAVLLGIALAWLAAGVRGIARALAAVALGVALAGVPAAVLLGLLPETARGSGLSTEIAMGNALHPIVLLQALLPNLFGLPQAPAEAWWGGRFFTKGTPYFLSIYSGPLVLALAWCGLTGCGRRRALVLGGLSLLGLWYALGPHGGLAPVLRLLPLADAFRFPSKALLLPHLALAIFAGFGCERLQRERSAFLVVAGATAVFAGVALAVATASSLAPLAMAVWVGLPMRTWTVVTEVAWRDASFAVGLAAAVSLVAALGRRASVSTSLAALLLAGLAAADLSRAVAGLNRQVAPGFFDLSPAVDGLLRDANARGRVFSYGVDRSPSFASYLGKGGVERTLGAFYAYRQVLGPYTNLIDGLPAAETKDLTAFAPRERELDDELLSPTRAGHLVPWWRNAGVGTVVSLDALSAAGLRALGSAPAGPPGLTVHAYAVEAVWPRAYIACRVSAAADAEDALLVPYEPRFDPERDVAVAGALVAHCTRGSVRRLDERAGFAAYQTEADGAGALVLRESWSRGWRATVDGAPVTVLRANGKHCAVAVPHGRHRVDLRYDPPGLRAGLVCSACALLLVVVILWRRA